MNSLLADNTVAALQQYLRKQLDIVYDEREAQNIVTVLFQHFKNWGRSDVVIKSNHRLSESEILSFHFASRKLRDGEPLQYVLRECFFYGLRFEVGPGVLIPRPETEELVKNVIIRNTQMHPTILDIGTGSGCIAIALAKNISSATLYAIDISKDALAFAEKNAAANNCNIHFSQLNVLTESPDEKFDIIVSNPPYVLESDKAMMDDRVLLHEPHTALFVADDDALVFYKRIIALSKSHLNPGGFVACEIHESKREELADELKKNEVSQFDFLDDVQGKKRMLFFRNN